MLEQTVTPEEFFGACVTPSLVEIGRRFEQLEIFLPEMVAAAEIVQALTDEVHQPLIETSNAGGIESQGAAEIVKQTEQENVDVIGLSSLLTSCLSYMKDVVDLLEAKGLHDKSG